MNDFSPMQEQNQHFLGIVAGPTASGKSSLGLAAALRHKLAIVSADSMQVYRGLTIGTGALTPQEQRGVPHHLIAIAEPTENFHAARFVTEARAAAAREWKEHGRKSLVVGGTGMWIQALREGLFEGPSQNQELRQKLRHVLDSEGPAALHQRLERVDPTMAAQLSPADHVRVLRAIEVFEVSGRPLSRWHEEDRRRREALGPLLPLYVLDRPREELYARINARVDEMLASGWIDEAQWLKSLELPEHTPARKALGYRELFRYLDQEIPLDEAREAIKKETRHFAKRQLTWFRAQKKVHFDSEPSLSRLETFLGLGA